MNGARMHGGPDGAGPVAFDFSANGNACGPCPSALAAVRAADAQRYPDPRSTQLREALAAFHGVAAERIVIAASASEFIFRITAWAVHAGVRRAILPHHGYGDYAAAALACGLTADADGPALAWSCEPSSPLGRQDESLQAQLEAGATVVLDRAYEPLRLRGAASFDAATLNRVWQLWSPNKAMGLCGVRAAYAIAPAHAQSQVKGLESLAPSWPLGAHGVALLRAWSEAPAAQWLAESRAILRAWKARQEDLCRGLGWDVLPGAASFFVARVPGLEAAVPALRAQGIHLRDCTSFGLPGHARLSVQPPAAQDALARAWKDIE